MSKKRSPATAKPLPPEMARIDLYLSTRMKTVALQLAANAGCNTLNEYVRTLIRDDAQRQGIKLGQAKD